MSTGRLSHRLALAHWALLPSKAVSLRFTCGAPHYDLLHQCFSSPLSQARSHHLVLLSRRVFSSSTTPYRSWKSLSEQRQFMDNLGKELGIKEGDLSGWYKVRNQDIINGGGRGLLNFYDESLSSLLKSVYPEHQWDILKFATKPRNYWRQEENQRHFFERLIDKLGFKQGDLEVLYQLTPEATIKHGGKTVLNRHGGSLTRAIMAVFPEHKWDPSKFVTNMRNYWGSLDEQRRYMREVGLKLGIKEGDYEAWQKVTPNDLSRMGGTSILSIYNRSMMAILSTVFPDHDWKAAPKHGPRPRGYWRILENQRTFLLDLGRKLGYKDGDFEAFYSLSARDINRNGGKSLLNVYDGSVINLLTSAFPEHPWIMAKFGQMRSSSDYMESRKLISTVERSLKIDCHEDWHEVTRDQLAEVGLDKAFDRFGGLFEVLRAVYPTQVWDESKFKFIASGNNEDVPQ